MENVLFVAKSKNTKLWKAYVQKRVQGMQDTFTISVNGQPHVGYEECSEAIAFLFNRFPDQESVDFYIKSCGNGTPMAMKSSHWSAHQTVQMPWQDQKPRMLMKRRSKAVEQEAETPAVKTRAGRKPQGDEYLYLKELGLRKPECNNLFTLMSRALEMDIEEMKAKCAQQYRTDQVLDAPLDSMSDDELEKQQGWLSEAAQAVRQELSRRKKKHK